MKTAKARPKPGESQSYVGFESRNSVTSTVAQSHQAPCKTTMTQKVLRARVRRGILVRSRYWPSMFPVVTAMMPESKDPRARARTENHTVRESVTNGLDTS